MSVTIPLIAADGAKSTVTLTDPVIGSTALLPLINIPTTQEAVMPGAVIVQPQGSTDVSANLVAAVTQIKNSRVVQGLWAPSATQYLLLPPGKFTVTQINALLGQEGATGQSLSLVIKGAGYNQTAVVFSPATAGPLMTNNYWQGIRIEGVSFIATTPGCTFLNSNGNNAAQDYAFTDCLWNGWQYICDLTGSNNNSEYRFTTCYSVYHQSDGSWLHIQPTGSEQFLNYWFYGCKMWQTSASIIDAAHGGSFHIYGMDVSDWGNHGTGPGGAPPCLFYFRSAGGWGVSNAHINSLRVEMKNAAATILSSAWQSGAISFNALDMSSQLFAYTYTGNMITVANGPTVAIRDSTMGGKINAPNRTVPVLVENTCWNQQASMAAVAASGVKWINCMNGSAGPLWNN